MSEDAYGPFDFTLAAWGSLRWISIKQHISDSEITGEGTSFSHRSLTVNTISSHRSKRSIVSTCTFWNSFTGLFLFALFVYLLVWLFLCKVPSLDAYKNRKVGISGDVKQKNIYWWSRFRCKLVCWFSNFSQGHLKGFYKHRFLNLTPIFWFSRSEMGTNNLSF